jgi:hypothetical protein
LCERYAEDDERLSKKEAIATDRPTKQDLETKLAGYISSYLAVCGLGEEASQEQLRWVASAMGWLVARHLEGNSTWESYRWVDAISPSQVDVLAPNHLNLEGVLIFGDTRKGTGQYWEPFSGSAQISETGDQVLSYRMMFGDITWGLGKVGYGKHPKGWNWSRPQKWLFTFSKEKGPNDDPSA